jgi:hypothetical protein
MTVSNFIIQKVNEDKQLERQIFKILYQVFSVRMNFAELMSHLRFY